MVTAPRSPWQNPYVKRLIGSIRRECLDHVIVWNETSLRRILRSYFDYYEKSRTHLALAKDAPEPRVSMDRRTVVSLPFLRWAACTIDTSGGLLSRPRSELARCLAGLWRHHT